MSDWTDKERAFLDAVKKEWGPTDASAVAVRAAIATRVAEPAALGADESGPAPSSPPSAGLLGTKAIVGVGVGVIAVGLAVIGLAWNADRHEPARPIIAAPAPSAATPPRAAVLEPATSTVAVSIDSLPNAAAQDPSPATPTPRAGGSASSASAPSGDTLAEELALLRTAQSALKDGQPDRALSALATHASRFPRGVLREERMTLQVLALCDTGRVEAARAIKDDLVRTAPGSSHLQRLERSCVR